MSELEDTMENPALTRLVDEVRDLPLTVSDVLAQVITECDNADASVSSLARIMAADQALAAMVLKLANSAYYGYARRIESLPDAVVLLGFASVKNLAITASITRLLSTDKDDLSAVRQGIFEHSLCAAVGARILGRTRRISGEKAFVAGLLHGAGARALRDAGFEPPPAR
jgi:HD-like signal output (HDOD) protein